MEDSFDHAAEISDRAKAFWAREDVDHVFNIMFNRLDQLREVLRANTATDKERVEALKIYECLEWKTAFPVSNTPVVQMVIGADGQCIHHNCVPSLPPSMGEDLPPLLLMQPPYKLHVCSKMCLPSLLATNRSTVSYRTQNPLKVPLLCGFKRMMATPVRTSCGGRVIELQQKYGKDEEEYDDNEHRDIIYKAPCGHSLRNYDDVMRFLLATESFDVLQLDYFSFNKAVQLDAVELQSSQLDLSRGSEPVSVELCFGPGDSRPADFRYRKERWPHGCFLTRGPVFHTCCECTDGCLDAQRCSCVAMTGVGKHYDYHRLTHPLPSGLYECGPWCSCDRARCQNRLVQRGIRVRLQVFWTERCGWGVRCCDDLDAGTFVCIYAGVILQRAHRPIEPPAPKMSRVELPSDDEVEVVTEWLAPPIVEGTNLLENTDPPTSSPLHVPVIQRPADINAHQKDKAKHASVTQNDTDGHGTRLKISKNPDDLYLLDARKEGNVSRFINLSAKPLHSECLHRLASPKFPSRCFFHQQCGEGRN
ncbi:histone-lysine N-methyltransferase SETDB2 isoform X2 [Corythoichthys intestinalis]|uniref:histone-lysine N-methyltransferase SETDB2 isoform X2 n=1 Tax=Corythoichthys intestinalis TaxID=161448 RepID=UPI0025A4D18C|nr:histone-lysine N-methyltransferase SETDB2 isoform X2 [Corythoichthys intestinalis]